MHGIESKSSPGWIFVRIGRQGERLEIEIEDTGSGMAEAKLTELQNNMCNADIEMLKGGGRVGIINACVRLKMVTENRVEFRVEGEEGVGTTVTIRIPCCRRVKQMLKVLLVDDEPFILQGLKLLVDWEKEGFRIAGTAANGMEALAFLKKEKVDLVIADIKMPQMTGLELLEHIRKEKISDAYFVILSGYAEFSFAQQAMQNDCTVIC